MGKKGGGKQRVPVEAKDNLKSFQRLTIVDLIGEGEIDGPVDGLKSVYLDDTPVQSDDGTYNFTGIDVEWTPGTPHQSHMAGFNCVDNEKPVNTELKSSERIVRTVTSPDVDYVRVTVGVRGLLKRDKENGDTNGHHVQILVEVEDREPEIIDIRGKTTSEYLKAITIPAPKKSPFKISVTRVSPDSETQYIEDKTYWSSYTEIIDQKLSYPHTALVGVSLDSSQFSGVPRRNYLVRGRRVRVPSNYDAERREYSGLWDGTFKIAWSDNPAWIFYDVATCERAGLGRRIGTQGVDKWSLYQISQYCDQMVDDGNGGKEPRFTCHVSISNPRDAAQVVSDFCSIFRAMPIWNGMQLSASADIPHDPVAHYSNANVIDGLFKYQSSGLKARKTAVHVKYISPKNGWKEATAYVGDDDAIARYGLHVENLTAFGCTSESQAIRAGRWFLATNQFETQTVSFSTFRDGLRHLPGDIISIADNDYAGATIGGRIKAVDGKRLTLDRNVVINDGETGFISVMNRDGESARAEVATLIAADEVELVEALEVDKMSLWTLATARIKPRLFRCIGIAEQKDGMFEITALQHEPDKHRYIEDGIEIDQDSGTLYGGGIPPVEHLLAEMEPPDNAGVYQVRLHWTTPRTTDGLKFEVVLVRDGGVHRRERTEQTELKLAALPLGRYTARVRGVNEYGQKGAEATVKFRVAEPAAPVGINFTPTNFAVEARPDLAEPATLGTEYEWYFGDSRDDVEQRKHKLGRAFILNHQGRSPDTLYWYGVQALNAVGRSSLTIDSVRTLLKPDDILDIIAPEIPKIDWARDLTDMVENHSSELVLLSDRAALVVNNDNRITGMTITAGDRASAIDFLSDFVSFTDPDTLERNLYWDNRAKTLVLKGEIRLLDGTRVSGASDLASSSGGVFKMKTDTGVFPSNFTATRLFESQFGMPPAPNTVFTLYALNDDGTVKHIESRMYDGRYWTSPELFIDGNLVALGTIRGDKLVAGIEINAPVVKGGKIVGAEAMFGEGGEYQGYHTHIARDGTIRTNKLIVPEGYFTHVQLATGAATSVHSAESNSNRVTLHIPSVAGSQAVITFNVFAWSSKSAEPPEEYKAYLRVYGPNGEIYARNHLFARWHTYTMQFVTPPAIGEHGFTAVITSGLSSSAPYGRELAINAINSVR
ncbi:host specificity protein J [Salinivibrio socompensis]|uniref:host specificity protein J n=1 Tax=Salinivibrio socompensis TaxID=1510206 RepID=UPI00046E88F2|nr:phage tail protein [Salinivibrio socompensis]